MQIFHDERQQQFYRHTFVAHISSVTRGCLRMRKISIYNVGNQIKK